MANELMVQLAEVARLAEEAGHLVAAEWIRHQLSLRQYDVVGPHREA